MASRVLRSASLRTCGSLAENAPSLNTGFEKRLVVAIGTFMPVSSRAPEPLDDLLALGGGRAGRHEVVIVEVHAARAELGELGDGVDGVERGPGLVPERVPPAVADRPQPEREAV